MFSSKDPSSHKDLQIQNSEIRFFPPRSLGILTELTGRSKENSRLICWLVTLAAPRTARISGFTMPPLCLKMFWYGFDWLKDLTTHCGICSRCTPIYLKMRQVSIINIISIIRSISGCLFSAKNDPLAAELRVAKAAKDDSMMIFSEEP